MTLDRVRAAYSAQAAEYVEVVGGIEHAAQQDRDRVLDWARGIDGPVADVGCGPGQWTHHLSCAGIDIEGIDPTGVFIAGARGRYPSARYRIGGRGEGRFVGRYFLAPSRTASPSTPNSGR